MREESKNIHFLIEKKNIHMSWNSFIRIYGSVSRILAITKHEDFYRIAWYLATFLDVIHSKDEYQGVMEYRIRSITSYLAVKFRKTPNII